MAQRAKGFLSNPSRYDRRIKIQAKTITTSADGVVKEVWVDYLTLWASREPLRGREFFAAAAENAEATVKYRVRYRTDIRSDMRIYDRGRIHNIIAPPLEDPYGDRKETHIMAELIENG